MSAKFLLAAAVLVIAATPNTLARPTSARSACAIKQASLCPTALDTLAAANAAALQKPAKVSFVEARQIYAYAPGAIYQLYGSPTFISTILLEPGESLNAIAAGDTSRWMVTQSEGETDKEPRTIVLVKPHTSGLKTNIVLITDRRTYTIEARAITGSTYSSEIAWSYPIEAPPKSTALGPIHTAYRIRVTRGEQPHWMPTRVVDDGRRTWIDFPADIVASEMPPLFVITPEGAELVNYRVQASAISSIACSTALSCASA